MKAKIGDWITIIPHAQIIWEENNPNKRFLIVGFSHPHHVILHDDFCDGLTDKDIKEYGIDPVYLGKSWWFVDDSSIQDIFSANAETKNLTCENEAGLDLL